MPKKKSGFPYEVHPSPAKGEDGRNIVYARPARGEKFSIKGLDNYSWEHYHTMPGSIERGMEDFLTVAAELMAKGYRIETPIGTFVPKLGLKRKLTDADKVKNSDVYLDGVDYNPGKLWNKAIEKWLYDGFLRVDNPNVQENMKDKQHLEEALKVCLKRGFVTVNSFAYHAKLSNYSARKQLEAWTKGDNPKLMKTKISKTHVYTEI